MRRVNERYGGFSRASGVVNGVGYIYRKDEQEEDNCSNRTLNAYVLIYLLEGGGVFSSALSARCQVTAGDAMLLFPGVEHTYRRSDLDGVWSECFVEFTGGIFETIEKDGLISRERPVLRPGLQPTLTSEFDELIRGYQSAVPGDEWIFSARTLLLLTRFIEADRQRHERPLDREFLVEACARLEAALDTRLKMADVASAMGMSERTFRRTFLAHSGVSPAQYRLTQRVAAARRMLDATRLTVDSIAERLGYCDVQFFIRQFKKQTGLSPERFRQRNRDTGGQARS